MHTFKVWAPQAKSMSVECGSKVFSMTGPDLRGWWSVEVESACAGTDYGFLVDEDGQCYPDPRSMCQPLGVHNRSRIYDQHAFEWSCPRFQAPPLASALVYELHIGTFTEQGTFDAAIGKLQYLADLGITYIELMPVASFAGHHGWGYDGVALYSVHDPYGGADGLKRFVDAAHKAGMAVLLDVVYNHFGPVGNYTGKFGPYLIDSHTTPWGGAINLEGPGSDQVRRFLIENALMWLRDYRIDGLRLDAVHALVDRSAIHFLEQLSIEVETLATASGRGLVLIAESDLNDPRFVTPREAGGFGMDAQWSDDFHHALFTVLSSGAGGYYADFGTLGQLAKALERTFVYDGIYSRYRRCVHGRPTGALSQHRFLGFIQNHDQIGNRALGDRISAIVGLNRAKIAAAIVFLSPFVPMIFQGEEWGASTPFLYFADHEDPEMARAISAGRRKEFEHFGWAQDSIPDPEAVETFERSKLVWSEQDQDEHRELRSWYQELIQLRRSNLCLNSGEPGNITVTFHEEERWIQFTRGWLMLICNLGDSRRSFAVPAGSRILLASPADCRMSDGAIVLPTDGVAIVSIGLGELFTEK